MFLWFKERRIRGPLFSIMTLGLQWALLQRQLPEPHSTKTFSHCLAKENSLEFPVQVENFVLLVFFCFLIKLHIVNIAFGNSVKRWIWKCPISSFLLFFFFRTEMTYKCSVNLHRLQDTFTYLHDLPFHALMTCAIWRKSAFLNTES